MQTGKTSILLKWLENNNDVAGILTPDVDGLRKLMNIATGVYYDLQLKSESGLKIGRFVFDEKIFEIAKNILVESLESDKEWIVIDEIGKLELYQNKGLEPTVNSIINQFQSNITQKKLLLVIRDYLLDDAVKHYKLHDAKMLHKTFITKKKLPAINGLVLCGGQSTRMKHDKSLINYNGKSQWEHVSELLQPFCEDVFLSVNELQYNDSQIAGKKILDSEEFADAGPLTGLLSAINNHPKQSLFVVGCDYPYLKRSDLLQIFNEYDETSDAICFQNQEKYLEPLIAIYQPTCFNKLIEYYQNGGRSLQQFLKQINTKFIRAKEQQNITSIDSM